MTHTCTMSQMHNIIFHSPPMSDCIKGTYASLTVSCLLQSLCGRLASTLMEQPDVALPVALL